MAVDITVLAAVAPLAVVGLLLVGLLWPATRAMPVAWLSAVFVAGTVWNMPSAWIAAATVEGIVTALQILWIVFGALVLLYTMMLAGAFDALNRSFATVSEDRRVQIILLAFFLAAFIEGVAGFGTPAAVIGPLLLGLGFPALAAVIAALIGHIIAVTYGAVGTPILVGIREPMDGVFRIQTALEAEEMSSSEFAVEVAAWAATYHLLVGVLMPFVAVAMVVYFFGEERSIKPALEVAPLCLFAGISFGVPYWIAAWYVTPEFPSLIGSMVGAAIVVSALRAGYFLPDDEWDFPDRSEWPDHWVGDIEPGDRHSVLPNTPRMSLSTAWTPYLALLALLVFTRTAEPIPALLQGETVTLFGREQSLMLLSIATGVGQFTLGPVSLEWAGIFGTTLGNRIDFAYVPGMWLLVSAGLAMSLFGLDRSDAATVCGGAAKKLVTPLIALVFVLAMANVMLQSAAHPNAPAESMIVVLATVTADVFGPAYPLVAALIGALGAALVGSNTVSNITFGPMQFVAAERIGISRTLTVGAQAVGGAIGNLVAIHNVVAALATVGLVGQEGRVIRLNLLPLLYYTAFVGLLSLAFVYVFFPELF